MTNFQQRYKKNFGKGWFMQPWRHSLAAKGVKTGRFAKKPHYIKEPYGLPFELTEKDKFRNPKKFQVLKESDYDEIKSLLKGGKNIDQVKDIFANKHWELGLTPSEEAEIESAFEKARAENRLEVQRERADMLDELFEVDIGKGITMTGPSMSIEAAEQAHAQRLRETGQAKSGSGEATASNVRNIINKAGFKIGPYAAPYINALGDAEAMEGERGVRSQVAYILSNLRASGPEQKEAKKQLMKIMKGG